MRNKQSEIPAGQVEKEKVNPTYAKLIDICCRIVTKGKRLNKRKVMGHQRTLEEVFTINNVNRALALLVKYKKEQIMRNYSKVQFITHYTERYSYLESVSIALEGGCRWIQLRMKDASVDEIYPIALEVKKRCTEHNAIFIIDDHVELAKRVEADGVHLGKTDMPINEARRILGPIFLIGGTANTYEDIRKLIRAGADYIGCGPFRYTETKKNLSPILGLDGYKEIHRKMEDGTIKASVIAIGGITLEDIPAIMQTGVHGIALSGTVLRAENPVEEMKKIISLTNDKSESNK